MSVTCLAAILKRPGGSVEMFVAAFRAVVLRSTTPCGPGDGNTIHLPTLLARTGRAAIYTERHGDRVCHLSLIRPPATELSYSRVMANALRKTEACTLRMN